MATSLTGKVVLVTGAGRGIGAETARLLAARGARLALLDRDTASVSALAAELGDGHRAFTADVTDQASLDAAVAGTVADLGGIDVVVANAGVAGYGTVRQMDPAAFARTIDINLTGVFRTAHAAIPHVVERRGYVLVVASLASFTPLGGLSAYCASKAGVESFARAFRMEVAHLGVDVGLAHPSWIDTDLVRSAEADLPAFKALRGKLPWPANSTTSVEECAEAVVRGVENRSARVYVPRAVGLVNALRWVMGGPLADLATRRLGPSMIRDLESDVAALGRSFATHVDDGTPGSRPL
jgi:NAD(P)-dependent dehydrogenase (short-subunit alcohol dehydrogenase family)